MTARSPINSKLAIFILIISLGAVLVSCENPWMEDILDPLLNPTVTFISNGGSYVAPIKTARGSEIDAPQEPQRTGFTFGGWYTDQQLANHVVFPYTVTTAVNLYAKWHMGEETYGISLSAAGTHTFGTAKLNDEPPSALTVNVTNTGNRATDALNIALSGTGAAGFELSQTSLGSIGVDGVSSFTVRPRAGLASGTYTATVTVSGGNNISESFNVSFTVVTYGISLNAPETHIFTAAAYGYDTPPALSVIVGNTGSQPTGDLEITLSGANPESFSLSMPSLGSISADGADTFTVRPVTGLDSGTTYTAVVTVTGQNQISESFNVSFTVLAGTFGIELSASGLSNGAYSFPSAVFNYAQQDALTVTVANTQNQPTGDLNIELSGTNPGTFVLSSAVLESINPGAQKTFTIVPDTGFDAGTYSAIVTVSGNGFTADFTVSFTVTPAPINSAAISVTAPATGSAPVTAASGTGNFTVSAVTWTRTAGGSAGSVFLGGTSYTASVTLTANDNYAFPANFTAQINSGAVAVANNTGAAVTISRSFDATAAADVNGISIITQPTKALNSYIHGDTLDLSGLFARLSYNDGTTEDVAFTNFGVRGITANPPHNTTLSHSTHNGISVKITFNGAFTADTNSLTVNPLAIESAAITVTPPVLGETPDTTAAIVTVNPNFTAGAVTWTRTAGGDMDNVFIGGINYTATMTLTANANYAFPSDFTAVIDGGEATVANNTGATVTVSRSFATETANVSSIAIKTQPTKALNSYVHGETLNLSGLVIELSYEDDTKKDVAFADFGDNNISLLLEGETVTGNVTLSRSTHNSQILTVSRGSGISANVGTLTVAAASQATLTITNPGAKTFGDADFQLSVSGGSGTGAVTYERVSGTAGTVSTTGMVTITGVGNIVVKATKAADADFNAAPSADLTITVNLQSITSAAVQVTAPLTGNTPVTTIPEGGTGYSCSNVTWTPAVSQFLGGVQYTASVTLTANTNYTFTGLTTATINGQPANVTNNTGSTVTLSYQFSATAKATGSEVSAVPTAVSAQLDGTNAQLTVNAVTLTTATGQDVQYAIGSSTAAADSLTWQPGTTFSNLTIGTSYRVYARSAENTNYQAGAHRMSGPIVIYGVTYNGNGNTGGTVPASLVGINNQAITIPGAGTGADALVRTGHTFNGWNTAADGSGTSYAAGSNTVKSADAAANGIITLYAQWEAITANETFNITYELMTTPDISITSGLELSRSDVTRNIMFVLTSTFTSAEWYVNGVKIGDGTSVTITLNPSGPGIYNSEFDIIGPHSLTVFADTGGVTHSKTVSFTVTD